MRIKNWREFQHFKDRTPPWIKLYRNLLDDPYWHELDGDSAKALTMLWLLASEDKKHEGYLPDIKTISFRLRISETKAKQIISKLSHWIITDDINVISKRYQDDTPETETYSKETEKETESGVAKTRPKKATQLPSDFELPEEWGEWAEGLGMTFDQIVLESEKFKDYWHGTGKPKADWQATWRNWIRSHLERKK
jgi:hypothetical protein